MLRNSVKKNTVSEINKKTGLIDPIFEFICQRLQTSSHRVVSNLKMKREKEEGEKASWLEIYSDDFKKGFHEVCYVSE